MRPRIIIGHVGEILKFFSISFFIPVFIALYFNESPMDIFGYSFSRNALIFLLTGAFSLSVGLYFEVLGKRKDFSDKEGLFIVSTGWLMLAFLASLPFIATGVLSNPADAYFESMSGLTTTGATVLSYPIESHPESVLFWRALLQYMGGMGIIVLSVAVLSKLTAGGARLMEAETPGPSLTRLKPAITQTAKLLWLIYVFFSLAEIIMLVVLGMPLYDAVYHTFTTMSTGGFSNKTAGIAYYGSWQIELVVILFMVIAGTNFTLHYYGLHGDSKQYFKDPEFRTYLLLLLAVIAAITWNVHSAGEGINESFRGAGFTVTSLMTSTGYSTANYNLWPDASRFLLLFVMIIGGCAGSTSGGLKVVRFLLVFKLLKRKVIQLSNPNRVISIKLGGNVIQEADMSSISLLFFAHLLIMAFSTLLFAAMGMDFISSLSGAISSLSNIGPALGTLGPINNFAEVPAAGKVLMSLLMWMGRLEIFTALIIISPDTYKKTKILS